MTTLTEFLLARIAEDETRDCGGSGEYRECGDMVEAFERHAKARRRIVEVHGNCECDSWTFGKPDECVIYRALAIPYADHRDYRQEWKP